jgi:hypothetical protein
MSRRDADMAVAMQDVLYELGDEVIHIPVSGSQVPLQAVINENLPQPSIDNDQGTRQVFTADLAMQMSVESSITAGRGTEVSRFQFDGHTWRAIAKASANGWLIVQVERHETKATKKGWPQGIR